ncbi:MAG: aldo/keto reductase [Bacillota bacterium]
MDYRNLGQTGIKVSELCFGSLPMGPLQANLPMEEGSRLIREALERGINFIDTAELYKTYDYIAGAIKGFSGEVVIASKSTTDTYEGMEKAIQDALKVLNREVIDIFHLHAARVSADVFEKRAGAFECLVKYKEKGYIKAVGISTHNVKTIERSAEVPEVDIVYPIINKVGRGILEGTTEDMIAAIDKCHKAGKGLYAMKVLAGGNLVGELLDAVNFVRDIKGIDCVSMGMINMEELELNLKIFNNEEIVPDMLPAAVNAKKLFIFETFCKKCGACVDTCPNGALYMGEDSVKVKHDECLLCAYCYPVCPEFAIRMI